MPSGVLRGLRHLLALMTTVPLGPGSLADAARAFHLVPIVGLLEGLATGAVLVVARLLGLRDLVAGAAYVAAHVLLTGALHLDGFADYADALGSRASGERALAILKDPRRGSFAVVAVALNLAMSSASASSIYSTRVGDLRAYSAYVLALSGVVYALSASSMYFVALLGRPEPYEGMAKLFSLESKGRGAGPAVAATALAVVASAAGLAAAVGPARAALLVTLCLAAAAAATALVLRDSELRLGFVNGDVLGFSYELTRVLLMLVAAVTSGAR